MRKKHDNSAVLESGWRGRVAFLRVASEINMIQSPHLEAALLEAIDSRPDGLVVDLSQVCFMDTSGIATLTLALARARKMGVSFWLVEPSAPVRRTLDICRLTSVFNIAATLEEAIAGAGVSSTPAGPAAGEKGPTNTR